MLNVRSKLVVSVATAFGVVLLIACDAVQTKSAAAQGATAGVRHATTTVRDTDGLTQALKSARAGDTVRLAPGSYATLGLRGVRIAGGQVTIVSADQANPAMFAGIEISESSGLTFRDLDVGLNQRLQNVFNVADCEDILLDRLDLHGPPGNKKSGVLFRASKRISVTDSKFHDVGTGLASMDSSYVTVSGNDFREIYGDGVQSTGTSFITITRNHFTNFHTAAGDHPDAIQFFTFRQKESTREIAITDNVVVRGDGDMIQGVFMGNEAELPYLGVKITGNKIVGAMFNGIAIGRGQDVTIANNIVQAYRDQDSWIRVEGSSNVMLENNLALSIMTEKSNVGLVQKSNRKLSAAKVGDISALAAPPSDK